MNAATGLIALAVAFAALFWHTFANLIPLWLNDPSYGHSGAVALAMLGFVGVRANKYPVADASPTQISKSATTQFTVGVLGAWAITVFAALLAWRLWVLWTKFGDSFSSTLA